MGEARNNVLSPQFKGELPQKMCGAVVGTEIVISEDWIKAQPPPVEGQEPQQVPPEGLIVVIVVAGQTTTPSALERDPRKWPRSQIKPVLELARIPYPEFVRLVEGPGTQETPSAVDPEAPPSEERH